MRSFYSSSPVLFSANKRELKFKVVVKNKNENSYNTQVSATFSNNLFYSSATAVSILCFCVFEFIHKWLAILCHVCIVMSKSNKICFAFTEILLSLQVFKVNGNKTRSYKCYCLVCTLYMQTDEVKCTSTLKNTVTCQVGYAVLKKDQEVSINTVFWAGFGFIINFSNSYDSHPVISLQVNFEITFDYSFDSQENQAVVKFEARRYKDVEILLIPLWLSLNEHSWDNNGTSDWYDMICSDGKEENPADNTVQISIPVQFDTGVVLSTWVCIFFSVYQ